MDKVIAEALADIIAAVDTPDLPSVIADGISRIVPSDLVSLFLHDTAGPRLLHDNFGGGGWRDGLNRYVHSTYRADPFVLACRNGSAPSVFRLGQLARRWRPAISSSLIVSGEEETGYRTHGWPPRMEEIGLGLLVGGTTIAQLSLYRPRELRPAFSDSDIRRLASLRPPLGAAVRRLSGRRQSTAGSSFPGLTPREQQIVELLISGRSSESIALTLQISVETVKTHRKNIYRKSKVSSSLELLRNALSIKPSV